MRLLKTLIGLAVLLGFTATARGAALTEISGNDPGHVQFPTSEAALAVRPQSASQKSLTLENLFIHDLVNQKGLDVRATRLDDAPAWAYQTITIKNSRFTDIERREDLPGGNGLHIDHIRISGGGNSQDVKTNITIENVTIDGGDALPILITDGLYGTVTLRNVKIVNTTLNNVQFKTDNVGSVDKIIVEDSPGIGIALIGRPGSIGEVLVRDSAGIRIGDSLNATGRTGAAISYIDPVSASSAGSTIRVTPAIPGAVPVGTVNVPGAAVPEPAALGVIAMSIPLVLRRRR
jgi:hypothetical protein